MAKNRPRQEPELRSTIFAGHRGNRGKNVPEGYRIRTVRPTPNDVPVGMLPDIVQRTCVAQ